MLLSIPLNIFWLLLWSALNGHTEISLTISSPKEMLVLVGLLFAFLPLALLHEILHALWFPGGLRSPDTIIGYQGLFAYAYTCQPYSRKRTLWIVIFPLLTLTVIPLFFDAALPQGKMPLWLAALIALHGGGYAGDLLNFALYLFFLPRGAILRDQGVETWYRVPQTAPQPVVK